MRSPNHRVVRTDGTRACHEIHNTDHTLVARHIRIDLAKGKKTFTWELPDGTKGLGGRAAKTLPLYRSETLRSLKPGAMVIVTEGEKAADALAALEFAVVGTVTGASGFPSDDVLRTLDGFHVVMWPDADVIGRKHGGRVLEVLYRLRGSATGLSRVDPGALGLTGQGDDAADWTPTDDALDELFAAIQPWTPPAPEPPQPDDEPPPPEDDPEETAAYMVPEGKTRAGLIKALEWVGIAVRFNERSARLELQDAIEAAAGKENWEPSDDLRGAKLREMVADTCVYPGAKGPSRLQFGRERWSDVLDAILDDRRVDPFKEWLNRLAPWDGEQRLDFWLGHIFEVGIIHEAILHWASRSVLMAVVARTFHPGEKHDEMVILVGPQGLGKSTVWAWLLPPASRRAWFSDALKFHTDLKTQVEALQGRVLVEVAEMAGSTRAEVESIKGFLARQDDGAVRLTYRRDPIDLPRRCVIVGSTNDPRCLPNDPSGNRRFVPVPVTAGNPRTIRTFMNAERQQLWAEAKHRVIDLKEQAWLPDELKQQQAIENEIYRATDEIAEDAVMEFLATNSGAVTIRQIADGIKWDCGRRSAYRITTVLKQLGYTYSNVRVRTVDGGRVRYWNPPGWTLLDKAEEGDTHE